MELGSYLTAECVVLLNAPSKGEALEELGGVLAESIGAVSKEELTAAVLKREELMSTGIGHGLGIPHVRLPQLKAAAMAVGISTTGIADYQSLDDHPVHIIVLIAAPQGEHELYIRLLGKVTDVLRQKDLRRSIIDAGDSSRIYGILTGQGQ